VTNFDIDRLLDEASDDAGRPLRRPLDDVVRRGRRRVMRRRIGGAAASTLAVGGLVSGAALWAGPEAGSGFDGGPAATGSSTTTTKVPTGIRVIPPPPVATMSDREIVRKCKVEDEEFLRLSENKAGGGTDPIDDWTVLIKQAPQYRVQAVLVSPDGNRRAYCVLDSRDGGQRNDYNREAFENPDYKIVTGGIDGAVDRVPDKVARVTFETPDGEVSEARIKAHIVLWFNGRPFTDGPVWANFYDASGNRLARFKAAGTTATSAPTKAVPSSTAASG
jgi:hypothetical protein